MCKHEAFNKDSLKKEGVIEKCWFHISDEPSEASRDTYMRCRKLVADIIADFPVMDALSEYSLYKSGTVGLPIPGICHAVSIEGV